MEIDGEVLARMQTLVEQSNKVKGEVDGLFQGIEAVKRTDPERENPLALKQIVGLTRDVGLKMIEMGQYMRRHADLLEPEIDKIIESP